MTSSIERESGVLDDLVGGRGADGEEPGADPFEQVIAGHIVARDDQHPLAAAGSNPVLGDGNCLRGRCTRSVQLGVRAPGADVLGHLGVPHRHTLEEEPPIEDVGVGLELVLQFVDAPVDLLDQQVGRPEIVEAQAQTPVVLQALLGDLVLVEPLDLGERGVESGEGRCEDHARGVAVGLGQEPAVGQLRAGGRVLVVHHQRDACVAERVEAGSYCELARTVERRDTVGREAEVLDQIDPAGTAGQLDDVGLAVDGFEVAATGFRLHESGDLLVGDTLPQFDRDRVDELIPGEQRRHLVVSEDVRSAGQPQAGSGDHDWLPRRERSRALGVCTRPVAGHDVVAPLEEVREEVAQLRIHALVTGGCRHCFRLCRDLGCRSVRCVFGDLRRLGRRVGLCLGVLRRWHANTESRRVQPAQRMVEADTIAQLRVVREQGAHRRVVAEHVLDQSLESLLGTHLDEHSTSRLVQRLQTGDELHRRCDLPAEDVDHLSGDVRAHRVELTVDVGDQRYRRRRQPQAGELLSQRFARRGDDLCMECVAHGERHDLRTSLGQQLPGGLDPCGRSADHRLLVAVDIGDHHVVVDRVDYALDLLDRCEDCRHLPCVGHVDVGHLASAPGYGFERIFERERTGRHQGPVLAQAVAHHHVGLDPVCGEHLGECCVDRQYGRLRDLGLSEFRIGLCDGRRVGFVCVDVVGERCTEDGFHHAVGFVEQLLHDRLVVAEGVEHVHILGSLSGVEEREEPRFAPSEEDPLVAQCLPHRLAVGVESPQRLGGLVGELVCRPEVDREPQVCFEVGLGRRRGLGGQAAARGLGDVAELLDELRLRTSSDEQCSAQRWLEVGAGGAFVDRCRDRMNLRPGIEVDAARHVLLENHVEVGPSEAERRHACIAHLPGLGLPFAQLLVDVEGRALEVDVRIGFALAQAGRELLLVEGLDRLEHPGGAGRTLQVADVGLHRAERDRSGLQPEALEDLPQARHLDHVTDPGGCPVSLDEGGLVGRETGVLPGACQRKLLADRVGGGDALSLPVAGSSQTSDDRVDVIAGPFCVGEPLEQEDGRAFPHHETVGTGVVRPGPGC